MNMKQEILDMKRKVAMDECFDGLWFTVCPLSGYHHPRQSRELLEEVHCIYFKNMSSEVIEELKRLVHEVLCYEEPVPVKEERKRWWQF